MFQITRGQGFQITLPNGWIVSVQFGAGNYGSNRNAAFQAARQSDFWAANSAEIACFRNREGGELTYYPFDADSNVKGWVTVTEFLEWLEVFKKLPPVTDQTLTLNVGTG